MGASLEQMNAGNSIASQTRCHSERSGAQRNAVEESLEGCVYAAERAVFLKARDPSTPLRSAQDDTDEWW